MLLMKTTLLSKEEKIDGATQYIIDQKIKWITAAQLFIFFSTCIIYMKLIVLIFRKVMGVLTFLIDMVGLI